MLRIASLIAAVLALSYVKTPSASAAGTEKVILSSTGTSALSWPIFGAQEKGFFSASGIDLDFIHNSSSAAGMQQLAAGSVNISSNGLVDPLRAIDHGAPITLLRLEMAPAPYQVFAKPALHSFASLKGKTVMLGGLKDITRIYFERMAEPEGLTNGSYDMVFAGTAASRMSALLSGSVDASILNPPFNFKAAAAGFSLLPAPDHFASGVPFSGLSVNTAWAKAHPEAVAEFLRAYSQGVDWFYDPENRADVINVLIKKLSISREDAVKTYDFYVSIKAFDKVGAITQGAIGSLIEILKAQGDIEGPTALSRFYDGANFASAR